MSKILVGADPEIFVKQAGVFKSAHALVAGDKKNPQKVNKGAVQVDGMALEFNIDPAENKAQFITNIHEVMSILRDMVPDYQLTIAPVADFGFEYLRAQPAEALELGCDPDYNAWTTDVNPRPNGERPFRTAAGHIHIGFCDDGEPEDSGYVRWCASLVRELDFYLGLPSLLLDTHPDSIRRRELYGKAGAFRPKKYGVEYRTLSNFWLESSELMGWAYDAAVRGYEAFDGGANLVGKYGDIQAIINSSDVKAAEKIVRAEGLM